MGENDNDFLKELLAIFKVEADEHINTISSGLIELEKSTSGEKQMEIVESVFREVHSLKGAARAVNLSDIESICQSFENILGALKRKDLSIKPEFFDILYKTTDMLGNLLLSMGLEKHDNEKSQITEILQDLDSISIGVLPLLNIKESERMESKAAKIQEPEQRDHPADEKAVSADTVRISAAKLDDLFLQVENLLYAKLAINQRVIDIKEINVMDKNWKKEMVKIQPVIRSCKKYLEKKDNHRKLWTDYQLNKLLEFIYWNNNYIKTLENKFTAIGKIIEYDSRSISMMVDGLLQGMKNILLLPFSTFLKIFPGFVRNLSQDQGKEVGLVIQGQKIEIDKRILDEMKDPLLHLVRNCIDHGMEKTEERIKKSKPAKGIISIAITQKNSSKVEILISDDGAGIDITKIKSSAIKLGILTPAKAESLGEKEALSLIFQSGVSSSPIITDISGRGLGLAIVREKVEKLGGTISCDMCIDKGTKFQIILPLTLSTFRGNIIRISEHFFVLPTANIDRVVRVNKEEVKTVENRKTVRINELTISLIQLSDVLGLPKQNHEKNSNDKILAVILSSGEKIIAFQVDEILNEQEVLVKNLGNQLLRVKNYTGAAVLGTGKLVPILNVPDLIKSAVKTSETGIRPTSVQVGEKKKQKTVLVVEDSITARTLLKNILVTAGYKVETAFDGIDGFMKLHTCECDIVVSDVDMPRMNGFDLTAKIRSDKKFGDLPVVLVTALDSSEHRERGIEVGANAYIIKSSFDQSNLLDIIRRLI